jgi:hypothetical protein
MIKILEVCSEQSQPEEDVNEDAFTDSNKTNMSFRELEEPDGDDVLEEDE